jgi:hypothetical protein
MRRAGYIKDNTTFNQFVYECMRECPVDKDHDVFIYKNIYTAAIMEGFYGRFMSDWFDVFGENVQVLFFNELKDTPKIMMKKVCDFIGISADPYKDVEFTVENKSIQFRSQVLSKLAHGIYAYLEKFLRKTPKVKNIIKNM